MYNYNSTDNKTKIIRIYISYQYIGIYFDQDYTYNQYNNYTIKCIRSVETLVNEALPCVDKQIEHLVQSALQSVVQTAVHGVLVPAVIVTL